MNHRRFLGHAKKDLLNEMIEIGKSLGFEISYYETLHDLIKKEFVNIQNIHQSFLKDDYVWICGPNTDLNSFWRKVSKKQKWNSKHIKNKQLI